jgi:transcriptional regulator with XRE-family HTH domain
MEQPDISGTIRAELARQRKSQQDLQTRLGLSRSSMYRRLTGEAQFDAAELVIVAEFLGVTVAELFGERTDEAAS